MASVDLDSLTGWLDGNPDFDPLGADLLGEESLAELDLADDLRAYQRIYRVARSREQALALLDAGYGSATQIAREPRESFVDENTALLNADGADRAHRRATRIAEQATHTWATLSSNVIAPSAQALRTNSLATVLPDAFRPLPSYQELFGSLNYYGCEECGSMLGPGAYLVELLRIIDLYVTKPNEKTIPEKFRFEKRRDDIPKIPLTCEEATGRLPYLKIVNERLAATAAKQLKGQGEPPIWKYMTSAAYPLGLPTNVLLEEIRILLGSVGVTLPALYGAWHKPAKAAAGASLGLSPAAVSLITTSVAGEEAELATYFGIEATKLGDLSRPTFFCRTTGIDVDRLSTLVEGDLTAAEFAHGISATFLVNRGLSGEKPYLAIGKEKGEAKIERLDHGALDRANRFIRLADALDWTFVELDWALHAVAAGQPTLEAKTAEATVTGLAAMRTLGEALELDVLDTASLLTQLKTYGSADGPSQFDAIFNAPAQRGGAPPYHPGGDPYNPTYKTEPREWTVAGTDETDQATAAWLSGSLGISTEAARELATGLFAEAKVKLDVPALSALRRHALLSKQLRLPIAQYLILLTAAGLAKAKTLTAAQLTALIEAGRRLAGSTLDAYTLQYVLTKTTSPYAQPLYKPAEVPAWLKSLGNQAGALSGEPFEEQLMAQLAILFGREEEQVEAAMPLAALSVALPEKTTWPEAFKRAAGGTAADVKLVEELLEWGSRWLTLAGALELPDEILAGVAADPTAFGIEAKPKAITLANVTELEAFHRFTLAFQDTEGKLLAFAATVTAKEPATAQAKALAAASGWEEKQVLKLLEGPAAKATDAVTAITTVAGCFELAERLGADTTYTASLAGLAELDEAKWKEFEMAAAGVRRQVASLYDAATWEANSARLDGEVEALKRDALLPLVRWQLSGHYEDITSDREVYEYALIEVETGPAVSISRIVEATNAAQLYLQRCRLQLEKGVEKLAIPETWWQWLLDYRVWQANREVFLYPENYLVPSVRRNRTAPFKELENELQQSQVTEDTVEEAYEAYFAEFHQLAKLKPVDCYHCEVDGASGPVETLFLFARSETEPPTYYYCTRQDGLSWTEWVKIDLSINSDVITPIYAFNRLFVFWAELKKATSSTVTSKGGEAKSAESITWAQTIKYSFLDHRGKWVPPQTLVEERIVNYEPPVATSRPSVEPFGPLLDMSDPMWTRVFVTKSGGGNLVGNDEAPIEFERISVVCGPLLHEEADKPYETTPNPHGENEAETEFLQAMYERTVALDSLIKAKRRGQLPVTVPLNLDINLQDNFVLSKDEFLILSTSANKSTDPTVKPQIDSIDSCLTVVPSGEVLYDEYSANAGGLPVKMAPATSLTARELEKHGIEKAIAEQIPPLLQKAGLLEAAFRVVRPFGSNTDIATPLAGLKLSGAQLHAVREAMFASMGTLIPFRSVSPVNGRTITVKNQPGWFQFDNGDESFVLTLPPKLGGNGKALPMFADTETGLRAQRPPLSPAAFEFAGINEHSARLTFTALGEYDLVDEAGNVNYEEAEEVVAKEELSKFLRNASLSAAQVTVVGNILINNPYASAHTFLTPTIEEETTKKIVAKLEEHELLDTNGRLTMTAVSGRELELVLGQLVLNKEITRDQIPVIYQIILDLTAPVEYAYENQTSGAPQSPWDYVWKVIRTSTGAADRLGKTMFAEGIPGLLSLATQQAPVVSVMPFERFGPDPYALEWPKALDGAQVDFEGVYGLYFWEVFFFVPMLVANGLSTNQQFEAAETWFRYVLNPTAPEEPVLEDTFHRESEGRIDLADSKQMFAELKKEKVKSLEEKTVLEESGLVNPKFDAKTGLGFLLAGRATVATQSMVRNMLLNHQVAAPADHYWRFWPFRNANQETLEETLSDSNKAIKVYEDDPLDPFAIAGLRIGAYEKATLMQYVQNLIAWGDSLFMQESFESTTAATMLYVYAFDLLGERPVELLPPPPPPPMNFVEIKEKNPHGIPIFLIELENTLPAPGPGVPDTEQGGTPFNALDTYFCVPENESLLHLWDTLEDRLYKIRNSMNIEGEVRELPLFAPPLNPLELVKAAAAGGGFLPAGGKPRGAIPAYRFEPMLARARSTTAQVMELGSKLLAALERRDAENLELLRSTQERQILTLTTTIKEDTIAEDEATLAGLRQSLAAAKNRVGHFQGLLGAGLISQEDTNLESMAAGLAFNILATGLRAAATIAYTIPQVGSPFAMTYGGVQIGSSLTAASAVAEIGSEVSNFIAQRSLTMAGYARREQDWTLALQDAQYEVANLEAQIAGAETRIKVAHQDLTITRTEITQNERVYEYLKDKFTSADLYQWLVGRISTVYFQAFRLALELSQSAQDCYQFELGVEESFVSFEYWDSLHKGLMAGENLNFSLAQMESAYTTKNTRRLEIERTVSLALWDPRALWKLRRTGKCSFELSEQLFDYDYPGQYNRQIKGVTVTIPAVLGPYEEFKATLRQTYSAVATKGEERAVKYLLEHPKEAAPASVRENWAPHQQIAISHGSEDAGVFEFNFHDERYLPFEGTGAVSRWELEVPPETNRFDLDAIGDVIVTVRYTALEGEPKFGEEVRGLLKGKPLPGAVYLSLAQAYATQWNAFIADHAEAARQVLDFELAAPAVTRFKKATLKAVFLRLETATVKIADGAKFLSLAIEEGKEEPVVFKEEVGAVKPLTLEAKEFLGPWKLVFDLEAMRKDQTLSGLLDAQKKWLDPAKLLNAELILDYEGSVF